MSGSAHKAFPSGEGGPLAVDEEIAKQQANRFQNHHFNKILFATPVAKSTSICQRHISYCEAVYHSSFIISFSRKRPSHLAAFFFEAKGQRKKLQKRKAVSVRLCLTLRDLLKKVDQNFKKWAVRHILSLLISSFLPSAKSSTILNS